MNAARLSAEERRESIVAAASVEFASGGYAGTSTEDIARRAGVSQPYLFRLFGTKKELFLAAVHSCFGRVAATFEEAGTPARAAGSDAGTVLKAMGMAYKELLRDRAMLRLQLQAYAASGDDRDIRAAVRAEFDALYCGVRELSGADEAALHAWFAEGMLFNVEAALGGDPEGCELLASKGGPVFGE